MPLFTHSHLGVSLNYFNNQLTSLVCVEVGGWVQGRVCGNRPQLVYRRLFSDWWSAAYKGVSPPGRDRSTSPPPPTHTHCHTEFLASVRLCVCVVRGSSAFFISTFSLKFPFTFYYILSIPLTFYSFYSFLASMHMYKSSAMKCIIYDHDIL